MRVSKQIALAYLNMTIGRPFGKFTQNDAKMMSYRMLDKMNIYIPEAVILQAIPLGSVDTMNKYLEGMWNSLIKDFKIELITNNDRIIQYK